MSSVCTFLKRFTYLFVLFNVYLREREHAQAGEGQREGDRGSEAGFVLSAQSPTQFLQAVTP